MAWVCPSPTGGRRPAARSARPGGRQGDRDHQALWRGGRCHHHARRAERGGAQVGRQRRQVVPRQGEGQPRRDPRDLQGQQAGLMALTLPPRRMLSVSATEAARVRS
eukprot:5576634-Prymnesium_polylepis.1